MAEQQGEGSEAQEQQAEGGIGGERGVPGAGLHPVDLVRPPAEQDHRAAGGQRGEGEQGENEQGPLARRKIHLALIA